MAYTAKYASAFYGPFREALASAPKPGTTLILAKYPQQQYPWAYAP